MVFHPIEQINGIVSPFVLIKHNGEPVFRPEGAVHFLGDRRNDALEADEIRVTELLLTLLIDDAAILIHIKTAADAVELSFLPLEGSEHRAAVLQPAIL